ncbi:MAG: nucleoside deaminase [Bacteroidota bacterium]
MSYPIFSDEYFMQMALKEAMRAYEEDEVPVGAVIVWNNKVIARTHNLTETLNDVTAHAEMQAFTSASNALGGKYLQECVLYVTLEPCAMCAGAAFWAQIGRIVFGAFDNKRGFTLVQPRLTHPKTKVVPGVLKEECGQLLKDFFANKRN